MDCTKTLWNFLTSNCLKIMLMVQWFVVVIWFGLGTITTWLVFQKISCYVFE